MSTHNKIIILFVLYILHTRIQFNDLPCELEHIQWYSRTEREYDYILQMFTTARKELVGSILISPFVWYIFHYVFLFLVRIIIIFTSLNEWKRTCCVRSHNLYMLVEAPTTHILCVAFAAQQAMCQQVQWNAIIIIVFYWNKFWFFSASSQLYEFMCEDTPNMLVQHIFNRNSVLLISNKPDHFASLI